MKKSDIIFLDKVSKGLSLDHFCHGDKRVYIAGTLAGLRLYEQKCDDAPGTLLVYIKNKATLNEVESEARRLDAQFLFAYEGLKPSEITMQGSFKGPEDTELPDARIKDFSLFKPELKIFQKALTDFPQISVIIPVFDNRERALKALNSWLQQDHSKYEIILVDDGSPLPWIEDLVGQHSDKLSLLQISRPANRKRGDHNFRAGLARNYGFNFSRSEHIVFCDSDIVVAPDMLNKICAKLQDVDLTMPLRWQLNEASSAQFSHYDQIRFNRDVILSPGAFWESFQTEKKAWNEHPNYWRWTSTFCLASTRAALKKVGLFKKSFVTYGFEDTELGYRFYKQGLKFSLLPVNTYHLFQPKTHSEYQNDLAQKKRLLKISADRLFRHHPVKEVYDTLQVWLD